MTNTSRTLRASFTFAGMAFIAVLYTRITYTYDSVEESTADVELYASEEGLETFLTYADPASPMGRAAIAALSGAM